MSGAQLCAMGQQCRYPIRSERRRRFPSIVEKSYLCRRRLADLARDPLVDGVANNDKTQLRFIRHRTKVKRLRRDLIQAVPQGDHMGVRRIAQTVLHSLLDNRLWKLLSTVRVRQQL